MDWYVNRPGITPFEVSGMLRSHLRVKLVRDGPSEESEIDVMEFGEPIRNSTNRQTHLGEMVDVQHEPWTERIGTAYPDPYLMIRIG